MFALGVPSSPVGYDRRLGMRDSISYTVDSFVEEERTSSPRNDVCGELSSPAWIGCFDFGPFSVSLALLVISAVSSQISSQFFTHLTPANGFRCHILRHFHGDLQARAVLLARDVLVDPAIFVT